MDSQGQNPKQKKIRSDALMEVLRGFGSDAAKSLDIFNGRSELPEFPFPPEEKEWLTRRLRQAETVRYQEKIVYSARQQETKSKVEALVQEVKKLGQAVQTLEKEVVVTAVQTPANPGVYHVNFFEKLISFVRSLTQKIEDSSLWLSAANTKGKKRSHYWNQFAKSGSKFMLSQERYMATQAG